MAPTPGDRILLLRPRWLSLILSGEKSLEIRGRNLPAGPYWLGSCGLIHGRAQLRAATRIQTAQAWQDLRQLHCVDGDEPPYKRTYGFPIKVCERVSPPIPFARERGAVGIVNYTPAV